MYLPTALSDELLFSRIVRLAILSGLKTSQIQALLFGYSRVCVHPHLTQQLNLLCHHNKITRGELYAQTLGPQYQMCLPAARASVQQRMFEVRVRNISRLWQLPNSKGQQRHDLKSCSLCAKEDIEKFGVSYWRKVHQMPNVTACPVHGILLDNRQLRYRYHLSVGLPVTDNNAVSAESSDVQYARFCAWLLSNKHYENKERLLDFIVSRLQELGFVTYDNRVRRQAVCESLFAWSNRLNRTQAYFFPETSFDYPYLRSILTPLHFCHPGRILFFLYWLSRCVKHTNNEVSHVKALVPCKILIEEKCLELLTCGCSLNETAKLLNKSRTYVKAIALRNGITDRLKPIRIDDKMRKSIITLASNGWHRKAIAKRFGISTGSVEMIISSTPGLVIRRREIKFESMRRNYRVAILRFLQSQPNAIRQSVFFVKNAAVHWLYQHDNEWLEKNLPSPMAPIIKR